MALSASLYVFIIFNVLLPSNSKKTNKSIISPYNIARNIKNDLSNEILNDNNYIESLEQSIIATSKIILKRSNVLRISMISFVSLGFLYLILVLFIK